MGRHVGAQSLPKRETAMPCFALRFAQAVHGSPRWTCQVPVWKHRGDCPENLQTFTYFRLFSPQASILRPHFHSMMRKLFSQYRKLLIGCVLNGLAVLAVTFLLAPMPPALWPSGLGALRPFATPLPWLAFAGVVTASSAFIWALVFGSLLKTLRRMALAAGPHQQGPPLGIPFKPGYDLFNLEQWIHFQKKRLELSEEKNRLLIADVAHELCSPLARMQRALSLAERNVGPDALPYMQKVENELQHVARLVEEVLSFSKTTTQPTVEAV